MKKGDKVRHKEQRKNGRVIEIDDAGSCFVQFDNDGGSGWFKPSELEVMP